MKQLYIDGNDYFCGMAKRLTYFKSLEKQAEQAGCTATRTRYHVNPAYDADLVENITIENGGSNSITISLRTMPSKHSKHWMYTATVTKNGKVVYTNESPFKKPFPSCLITVLIGSYLEVCEA